MLVWIVSRGERRDLLVISLGRSVVWGLDLGEPTG